MLTALGKHSAKTLIFNCVWGFVHLVMSSANIEWPLGDRPREAGPPEVETVNPSDASEGGRSSGGGSLASGVVGATLVVIYPNKRYV